MIDIIQVIDRGGVIETTVDHSDIRGLGIYRIVGYINNH